jgi:protein-disulfide isomerase
MPDIPPDPRHIPLKIFAGIDSPAEALRRLLREYNEYLEALREEEEEEKAKAEEEAEAAAEEEHEMDISRLSLLSATRREAIKAAQTQEKAIRERLKKDGAAFPPYKFLELIGKGSYGRVYKW